MYDKIMYSILSMHSVFFYQGYLQLKNEAVMLYVVMHHSTSIKSDGNGESGSRG